MAIPAAVIANKILSKAVYIGLGSIRKVQVGNEQEKAQSERDSHSKKLQFGNDQAKAQSEKDSHSKYRVGKKLN